MNDRYGVDPQTPSTWRDLADLLRLFNPSEGRFVIEYPDGWGDRLRQHVISWSDLDRKRAEEAVALMQRVLLPDDARRYDDQLRWAENALVLTAQDLVRSLIGPAGSPANVAALPDLMEQPQPLLDVREAFIPRDASHYLKIAEPVFRTSQKIVVIDKFFRLHDAQGDLDGRDKVLESFLTEAERGRVKAFHLVVDKATVCSKDDPKGERYLGELDRLRSQLRRVKLTLSSRTDCCHARYLIGNHLGLQFDHGFEVDDTLPKERRKPNHVHWLTNKIIERLHRDYGWAR